MAGPLLESSPESGQAHPGESSFRLTQSQLIRGLNSICKTSSPLLYPSAHKQVVRFAHTQARGGDYMSTRMLGDRKHGDYMEFYPAQLSPVLGLSSTR